PSVVHGGRDSLPRHRTCPRQLDQPGGVDGRCLGRVCLSRRRRGARASGDDWRSVPALHEPHEAVCAVCVLTEREQGPSGQMTTFLLFWLQVMKNHTVSATEFKAKCLAYL